MKILLFNPKIDAEHKISRSLEEKGVALLFPEDLKEAWQMLQLHGTSVDLAIIHLENLMGDTEPVQKLLEKIKKDPTHGDLPLILTTDRRTDEECSQHQAGPTGANAYLRWPFQAEELFDLIQAVLGLSSEASVEESPEPPGAPPAEQPSLEITSSGGEQPPPVPVEISDLTSPSGEISLSEGTPSGLSMSGLSDDPLAEALRAAKESAPPPPPVEEDQEVAQEMPYLFANAQKKSDAPPPPAGASMIFAEPVGDAVVPGGAANAPDLETFKKYLLLREQDVAVLSNQLKAAHDQISMLEQLLREEKGKNAELTHVVNEQKHKIEEADNEKTLAMESLQNDLNDLRFQVKAKTDKARVLEIQVREVTDEMEHLRERVRSDIRKIRTREKELENRLEIMKKDSEALIGARENKIIELKRKLDLMEFNMDLLQDQHSREKEQSTRLKERLAKAAQVVRVAGGLLDAGKDAANQELEVKDPSAAESSGVSGQKVS